MEVGGTRHWSLRSARDMQCLLVLLSAEAHRYGTQFLYPMLRLCFCTGAMQYYSPQEGSPTQSKQPRNISTCRESPFWLQTSLPVPAIYTSRQKGHFQGALIYLILMQLMSNNPGKLYERNPFFLVPKL